MTHGEMATLSPQKTGISGVVGCFSFVFWVQQKPTGRGLQANHAKKKRVNTKHPFYSCNTDEISIFWPQKTGTLVLLTISPLFFLTASVMHAKKRVKNERYVERAKPPQTYWAD